MLFIVALRDIDDNTEIRARLLDAHMEHIGKFLDRIKLAGPLLREQEEGVAGGMLVVEADAAQDIRDMVEADPYYQAGLWDEVRIQPFKEIINAWKPA